MITITVLFEYAQSDLSHSHFPRPPLSHKDLPGPYHDEFICGRLGKQEWVDNANFASGIEWSDDK
jgi:hypothetical protein